jgi:uncharacterized protein (TIGR02996 family)
VSIESEFIDWINEHPDDVMTQLVYADWLEEHGDPMAEALRVLVERGRRPMYLGIQSSFPGWNWFTDNVPSRTLDPRSMLPDEWFVLFEPLVKGYPDFFSAMSAAAIAWIRETHDPDFSLATVG